MPPSAQPVIRLSLSLSPELHERVQNAADREGIAVSEWLRRAALAQLERNTP